MTSTLPAKSSTPTTSSGLKTTRNLSEPSPNFPASHIWPQPLPRHSQVSEKSSPTPSKFLKKTAARHPNHSLCVPSQDDSTCVFHRNCIVVWFSRRRFLTRV